MTRFLVKLFVWAIGLVALAWALEVTEARRSEAPHPTNLLLGDSHAGPVDLRTFANLSHAADPLFVQTLKALRFVDMSARRPNFVVLTVGPHNFSSLSELRIQKDHENWRSSNAERLAALTDIGEYPSYLPHAIWMDSFIKEFSLPEHELLYIQNKYRKTYTNNSKVRIERQLVGFANWFLDDSEALNSIGKLVDLTQDWEAQLILLETPRHDDYDALVEPAGLLAYRKTLTGIANGHDHVTFVPSTLFAADTEWFSDSDHLNSFGAECMKQDLIHQHLLPSELSALLETGS